MTRTLFSTLFFIPASVALLTSSCVSTPHDEQTPVEIANEAMASESFEGCTNGTFSALSPTGIVEHAVSGTNAVEAADHTPSATGFLPALFRCPPRPWTVYLKNGSEQATIDGVLVFLSNPAIQDKDTKKPKAGTVDAKYTISPLVNSHTKPIVSERKLRVFIDPGHGGADPGASSRDGKLVESRVALDISNRLAEYLTNAGFEVMLSRRDNTFTQVLDERPMKASRWKADIFVSIHLNSNPASDAHGLETYILPPPGTQSTSGGNYSTAQAEAGIRNLGNANDVRNMQLGFAIQRRALKSTHLVDRGLRRARFAVLRDSTMPAVLVECGFLSSPRDQKLVRTAEGNAKLARGIYEGICDYAFGTLSPAQPPHPLFSKDGKPLPSSLFADATSPAVTAPPVVSPSDAAPAKSTQSAAPTPSTAVAVSTVEASVPATKKETGCATQKENSPVAQQKPSPQAKSPEIPPVKQVSLPNAKSPETALPKANPALVQPLPISGPLPDAAVVANRTPEWTPPALDNDPHEDPRIKQARLNAAKAAGL